MHVHGHGTTKEYELMAYQTVEEIHKNSPL